MARQVRVHGVRREFDVERYAAIVIALAKHLAETDEAEVVDASEEADDDK